MEMHFRLAIAGDLPEIVVIYNSTIAGRSSTADTEPVTVQGRLGWFMEHDQKSRPLWVLEDSSGITGWISLQSFYGRPAYMHTAEISIYIKEGHRGAGLGSSSLEYALGQCRSLGIHALLGFIFAHNQASIRLFEKWGFERWGFLPGVALLDGKERSLVIMGKRLES